MKERLSNEMAFAEYDPEQKHIYGGDYTDRYNEPRFYNTKKRGINKAWEALKSAWNDDMTAGKAKTILHDHGIDTHSYCAMD